MKKKPYCILSILVLLVQFIALQGQQLERNLSNTHGHTNDCMMKVYESITLKGERKLVAGCATMTTDEFADTKRSIGNQKIKNDGKSIHTDVINITSQRVLATINVSYFGFGAAPQALAAFQYAVDIWSSQLNSSVVIEMNATWQPLGPGVLGSAGTTSRYQNFINAPVANTQYPAALANAVAGTDLNSSLHDINANFNSNFPNWYFGTDANPPPGQFDFVSIVLHELGHGLGFQGSASYNTGSLEGFLGNTIFDKFIKVGAVGIGILPNPSLALGAALLGGNLAFDGPQTTLVNFGVAAPTHAPSTYAGGSSYSHWAETAYLAGDPNSLMTPQIGPGEANHEIGAITRAAFRDMGWVINNGSTAGITPSVSVSGNTNLCAGQSATFTADPSFGGTRPSYQWIRKRGLNEFVVSRTAIYTASDSQDNDEIKVRMVSVNPNANPVLVVSAPQIVNVSPTGTPTVSIVVAPTNIIQIGQLVTFTATSAIGGIAPTYIWLREGNVLQSGSSPTFSSSSLNNGDIITVAMQSNSQCKTSSTANSNAITIIWAVVSAQEKEVSDAVKIYPNPSSDFFNIDKYILGLKEASINIYDVLGQNVMNWKTLENNFVFDATKLAKGYYILEIQQGGRIIHKRIIKQ